MKPNKLLCIMLITLLACFGLTSCTSNKDPDFSGYKRIAELATLECTFHNVAEVRNDGTDILFGINIGYKKAWFEYDGKLTVGVDVSRVKIEGPDANGIVTITVPDAEVLGLPDADESTFSDIYSDTGLFTPISAVDQSKAYSDAQTEMKKVAESNSELMSQAKDRAQILLKQYIEGVGESIGQNYKVVFADAE